MDFRILQIPTKAKIKFFVALTLARLAFTCPALANTQDRDAHRLNIFQAILYYDGYASRVDLPVPKGILRLRNDLYARRLNESELQQIGSNLTAEVTLKPSCDNYDRIGSVNIALVPKGAASYSPDSVQRLELGRFITPFMNMNRKPDTVSYSFLLDQLALIFHDRTLRSDFDFWIELEVFGVPYAAQTQVAGCAGRNDVYFGYLDFVTSGQPILEQDLVLMPLNFRKDLNNYAQGASDAVGQTIRTISLHLDSAVQDAHLYLITSNHGSNVGGEEYNRRLHKVKFDGVEVLTYTPGGVSCEPYRIYNTQSNGIYGRKPRTEDEWASFSNWCPGQSIPVRDIALGALSAGTHIFEISVPDAVFQDRQGYIPVSLYLKAKL